MEYGYNEFFEDMDDIIGEGDNADTGENIDGHMGHRDRLRMRIMRDRLDGLRPRELLEFLLSYVIPRQDINRYCQALLDHFGDVRSILLSNLEELRKVQSLGENAAEWIAMICDCLRIFLMLKLEDTIWIEKPADLHREIRRMKQLYGEPCCIQLLCDRNGMLLLRRPLARTLHWGDSQIIRRALDDVISTHAVNAYMVIRTQNHAMHPNEDDMEYIRGYELLLRHSRCALRDVVFISEDGFTSMRALNRIPDSARTADICSSMGEEADISY